MNVNTYLYIVDPMNIDHLQPIFRQRSPMKGIEIPWSTIFVDERNMKSSYLKSKLIELLEIELCW